MGCTCVRSYSYVQHLSFRTLVKVTCTYFPAYCNVRTSMVDMRMYSKVLMCHNFSHAILHFTEIFVYDKYPLKYMPFWLISQQNALPLLLL